MGDSNFDLIAREILRQKQRKELLEGENQELRKQLADLRTGSGIFVEIEGKRFPLIFSTSASSTPLNPDHESAASLVTAQTTQPIAPSLAIVSAPSFSVAAPEMEQQKSSFAHVDEMTTEHEPLEVTSVAEESETQVTKELEKSVAATAHASIELTEEDTAPTFLEEAMIDEFTSASTSPLSVWTGPVTPQTTKSTEDIAEEEKAALRRQLIGSFLLG